MAFSVVHGAKRVENRPVRPPHELIGHVFAIHASKTFDEDHARQIADITGVALDREKMVYGAIVGLATLLRVVTRPVQVGLFEQHDAAWDDPWFTGPVGLVLTDVRALPEPIACRGMQGYWNVPPDVEAKIAAQLEGRAA